MPNSEYLINFLGLASIITIISLAIALASKMERIKQLRSETDNLKKSLDEMDEQAKLIVRTDLELNKTQEELDKKIGGLYALQRLSRAMSTTLEENQIAKMMESSSLEDLGFEKACSLLWSNTGKKFSAFINIGYPRSEISAMESTLNSEQGMYLELIKSAKTLSSISLKEDPRLMEKISRIFKVKFFVLSPLLPKEGNQGFLLVGTNNLDVAITEGDEELITILSNQIGSSLENARLFEKTWRAHQDLENKVEERTRELTLALEEVKKISQRKTDFISSVSHELRTPLTSIKGYASILLAEKLGKLPEEVRIRLDKINRHSDELTHLVNDLLDISRIEAGKVTMKQEAGDLKGIVDKVLDLLSLQLKEKQLDVSIDILGNANKIFVDRSQIERVFINIIGNAIKFTPQKGKIGIRSLKTDQQIQVDIMDSGCGIPEDALDTIFEEFYRVDNPINQQVKGTGLGLTLVKHIIEAHKGKIWAKSQGGQGSTFSFTLPQAT